MSSLSDSPLTQHPGSNAGAGAPTISKGYSPLYQEFIQPLEDYIKKLTEEIASDPDKKYRCKLGWTSGRNLLAANKALRAGIDSGDKAVINRYAGYNRSLGRICRKLNSIKADRVTFVEAVISGDVSVVRLFIAAGTELNARDSDGNTALHLATKKGQVEVVKALLLAGADVNAKGACRYTALYLAAMSGYVEVVKALLAAGADVNVMDFYGNTALYWAAMNRHAEVVKALGEAGADLNVRSSIDYTVLHWAAMNGDVEVVDALFSLGVDASIKMPRYNKTALQLARGVNKTRIVNILQDDQTLYLGPMGKTSLRGIWVRAAVLSAKTMHSSDRVEEMSSPPTQLPGSNAGAGGPSP